MIKFLYIFFVVLVSIQLWSFHSIPDNIYDILEVLVSFSLIAIVIIKWKEIRTNVQFRSNVLLFILIPIISSYGAAVFHDQSFYYSLLLLRYHSFWLLYFVLHIFNIQEKYLIKMMIFVGCIWIFLTIIQQFTFPNFIFYSQTEEHSVEFRAGVHRFFVYRHHYGLFILFYFFYEFLLKKKISYLLFVFIALIGFYFFGTRQFAVAAIVCLLISSFIVKGTAKAYSIILILIVSSLLIYYKDILLGEYIEMTRSQLTSDNDIRLLAAKFFLFDYWPNWMAILIGNGEAHSLSNYGHEYEYINGYMGYYKGDVGVIGTLNTFGIFYIINIIWLNIKALNNRFYTENNKYLILFFINSLILLFLSEYYSNGTAIPFFCIIFYLVDKSYENKVLNTL